MHLIDLTRFLQELANNNNRAWFVMNRPRYDILREEFLALVITLIHEIGKFDPLILQCNPKKALFRINRDVRFSNNKDPYKTVFSAALTPNDLKRPSEGGGPCYYLRINQDGALLFGAGEYIPPPQRLSAIRRHIVADADGFGKVLKNKKLRTLYGDFQREDKLARPPKGYTLDSPHLEYLKLKSIFAWTEVALNIRKPEELLPTLRDGLHAALPLVLWLRSVPTDEPQ